MFIILFFIACGFSFFTLLKPHKQEQYQYIPSKPFKIIPAQVEQKGN